MHSRPGLIPPRATAKHTSVSLPSIFAALAADQTSLAALWRAMPAGVCVYDTEARPQSHNEAFTRIASGAPAQAALSAVVARALAGETVTDLQAEWPGDAGPQHIHLSAIPVRDQGRPAGAILVITDAGGGAGLRETLGIVGHDLRNPLAAIRMTAQLLGKPDEMTAERRSTLSKRILTSSSRMDSIVKSLLDFAKAKAGALVHLERETVDLGVLAARVIEELTANLTGRSIDVKITGDVTGQWDPGRLEQIVGQLVSNAVRHGADGVSVMTLTGGPTDVELALESRGPTIPADLLPRLFDPFQIGPRPEGTPRRSIGLGLFVVRELASAHGGTTAISSHDGTTRVTVKLPRSVTPP
jgi:signal transduction histidine kinase